MKSYLIDYYNHREIDNNVVGTITTGCATNGSGTFLVKKPKSPIRKLTQKECWRLMGFSDEDFERAESVCSNTQLYKQAGNSIVVNVLEEIFKKLLEKRVRVKS